ncbi:succinylglutamate desuccinylase/aspartoacylase family protein [Magnetofaba australis]|uniref:Putative succinylglutamate desuccinylase n=1 Tax=Magnetofaba australis IT-1 TaxID=1434232 RepID=A0A1Y2K4S3_9PROT|nr:succinylglutamate desuccinylase/aspartoacylase family protein [Magnetofaba australis]OSM04259.1 putative succinylglutamate desuccinylase [Magnetofaba australis IT-1]
MGAFSDHTRATLPVHVAHGRTPGPAMFLTAAVHGNEIIGVEVIRRVLRLKGLKRLRGTLLCVPIVNIFGFISQNRYLPDRRDLNRSFPGSPTGSLAGQMAHLLLNEVITRCDYGIDLHSAAIHRSNLPQIRMAEGDPELIELAKAFSPPLIMQAKLRKGSMREAAQEKGVKVLLYEAGEALRFDEFSVRVGLRGVLGVMRHLGMLPQQKSAPKRTPPLVSHKSIWVRAPSAGLLRAYRTRGEVIEAGQLLGIISDPLGDSEWEVISPQAGIIIGRSELPVINQGDALFHVAEIARPVAAEGAVENLESEISSDPLFDEDEIL